VFFVGIRRRVVQMDEIAPPGPPEHNYGFQIPSFT
jgi:hypothetical protein